MNLPKFLTSPNPEIYLRENYVVVDFETTTIGKGLAVYPGNRVVAVAWSVGSGHVQYKPNSELLHASISHAVRYVRASEFQLGELLKAVETAEYLVFHNAKFDLQWLARAGLDLTNVLVYDTLLGEYVLGGNRWLYDQLSLDAISKRRWGYGKVDLIKDMWDIGIPTEDIPEQWLEKYCVRDVELTERLFLEQRKELDELGLLPVLYNRCLLTPVLADIEPNGMQLDAELVRTKYEELNETFVTLETELTKITEGINFNSGKQVATYLYETLGFEERQVRKGGKWVPDRTDPSKTHPTGQRKTDAETIATLKPKTAQQKKFVEVYKEYKGIYYELTKYFRKMQDCCEQANGHLLAKFNQANTRTHRLSSAGLDFGMQFQNFPRDYKTLFKAKKDGWLVGECDGAQLEFRDAVHLGRDRVGLFDITSGTDIHSVTASVIWPNEDPKIRRQDAKTHTFKPLYGGQSGTDDEKRYYKFFRDKYKDITAWQQKNIDFVLEHKYLKTEWGLRYYWPNTTMDRSGYVKNSTAICNYPVQAQATAEIIPMALVWFWHRLKRSGLKMYIVNTVHDSIVVELPPEETEAFNELSRQCLIDDVYSTLHALYGIRFTVPLGAGIKVGTHWGVGKEVKYSANESLWLDAAKAANMV